MALASTTISAAITAEQKVFHVTSGTSVAVGRILRINDEYTKVQAFDGSTEVSVQRGIWGTLARAHGILSIAVHGLPADFAPRPKPRMFTYGAATGAIELAPGLHRFAYAGAGAFTIAQPTADMEGEELTFVATAAQAYTLATASSKYFNGATNNLATWGGAIGDTLKVQVVGGNWIVTDSKNVTLSAS